MSPNAHQRGLIKDKVAKYKKRATSFDELISLNTFIGGSGLVGLDGSTETILVGDIVYLSVDAVSVGITIATYN